MIEIIHPGIMSLVVDGGRYGHREVGIPPSPALDSYALSALNHLLGNEDNAPAIEVFGEKFSLRFGAGCLLRHYGSEGQSQLCRAGLCSPGCLSRQELGRS